MVDLNATSGEADSAAGSAGPPRQRARQQRTIDTRERILDAGLEAFARRGFEGASLPSIAAKAGVPHGLITYHFENKDGLWREVLRRTLAAQGEQVVTRLRELRGVDEATVLRSIFEDFIRRNAKNPQFNSVMLHAFANPNERLDWMVTEFLKPNFLSLGELIARAQAKGRFIEGDPIMLQYLFVGSATRVFAANQEVISVSGRSPFSEAFIEEHIRLCLSLFFR